MATILVEILGNAKQFKAELDSTVASTAKANGGFAKMGKAAGVAGLAIAGGLAVGLVKSVEAADAAQQATARMNTAFAASHVSAKKYAGAIEEAEGKARKLGFTNTDVKGSLGSLVIATHDGAAAIKDLGVAQDIARFKHVSLETATKTLTMAMSGSQRAVKQLGITVNKSTEATDAATVAHKKALEALKAQFPATAKQTQAEHDLYLRKKDSIDADFSVAKAQAKVIDLHVTSAKVIATVSEKLKGQADAFSKTAAGGMAQFHAQLDDVGEKLGKAVLPALQTLAEKLAAGATFLSEHTTLAKGLVIGLGALAAVLLTVSIATTIAGAATSVWSGITAIATAAQWLWNAAMDANPIGLLVIAIAGLIAAGVLLYKNSETVRNIINAVWDSIKNVAMPVINWFTETAFPKLKAAWDAVSTKVSAVVTAIIGFISDIPGKIGALLTGIETAAENIGKGIYNKVTGAVTGVAGAVAGFVGDIPGKLSDLVERVKTGAGTIGSTIYGAITGALSGLGGAVEGLVKAAINSAIGLLDSGFNVIHDHWPDIPGAPGAPFGHNPIPKLAMGGIVTRPTLAMIGEAGPEAVIPLSRAGGMGTQHFYLNTTGLDEASLARKIWRQSRLAVT